MSTASTPTQRGQGRASASHRLSRGKLYTGGRLGLNLPMTLVQTMERVRLKREGRTGLPSPASALYREALARGLALMEAEEDTLRPDKAAPAKQTAAEADAAKRQLALIEPPPLDPEADPWPLWRRRALAWAHDEYRPRTMGRHIAEGLIEAWAEGRQDVAPRHLPPACWGEREDRLPRAERIAQALRAAVPTPTPLFGLL